MKILYCITILCLSFISCDKKGCTDVEALNYASEAKSDDASCLYSEPTKQGIVTWEIKSLLEEENFSYNSKFKINDSTYAQFTFCQMYLSHPNFIGYAPVTEDTTFTDNYVLVKTDVKNYAFPLANEGTYQGYQFYFGVDSVTNNTKSPGDYSTDHALGTQFPSMYSDSAKQYVFLKLEGLYDSDYDSIPDAIFQYHIGADKYLSNISTYNSVSVLVNDEKAELLNVYVNWSEFLKNIDVNSAPMDSTSSGISDAIISNLSNVFIK